MVTNTESLRSVWLILLASFGLMTVDVAHAQAEDVAAGKKQCLTQHEQSQILKQSTKLREAREALLMCSRDICPSFVRADCVEWLGQLDRIIPSVVISAKVNKKDEFNIKVTIDGQVALTRLDGRAIELNPGIHMFRFDLSPWPPIEQQVLMGEGEKNRIINVQFGTPVDEKPGAEPPSYRPIPTLDYILAGTALAGIGVFAAFGTMGKTQYNNDAKSLTGCKPFCSTTEVNSVKTKLLIADIGLGVAVASTIGAIIVFATRPSVPLPAEEPTKPGKGSKTSFGIEPMRSGAFMSVQTEF